MNGANNRRLHGLLTKTGLVELKDTLVMQFTNGRTEHSSEMDDAEACQLITYLEGQSAEPSKDTANDLRRRIISKFREMDYNKDGKADMDRIQAFVREKWGKELNGYNIAELRRIVGVLERRIVPWWYKQNQKQA